MQLEEIRRASKPIISLSVCALSLIASVQFRWVMPVFRMIQISMRFHCCIALHWLIGDMDALARPKRNKKKREQQQQQRSTNAATTKTTTRKRKKKQHTNCYENLANKWSNRWVRPKAREFNSRITFSRARSPNQRIENVYRLIWFLLFLFFCFFLSFCLSSADDAGALHEIDGQRCLVIDVFVLCSASSIIA